MSARLWRVPVWLGVAALWAGGCTSLVGLDEVEFTGSGGATSGSGATTGGGASGGATGGTAGGDPQGGATTSSTQGGSMSATGGSTGSTTTMPSPFCGDGALGLGEECDDGNGMSGDGCSSMCLVEPFFQCSHDTPSTCSKSETICDDGIDNDGDGQVDAADFKDCSLPAGFNGCAKGSLHVYKAKDTPVAIPVEGTIQSHVFVADSPTIVLAAVVLNIVHPEDGDLEAILDPSSGSEIILFTKVGGVGENFTSTVLSSTCATQITAGSPPFSGCFKPEESLFALFEKDGHGEWSLQIKDDSDPYGGSLESWALVLCSN